MLLTSCAASRPQAAGAPPPWQEFHLEVGGKSREYYLVRPNSAKTPLPSLFFLHGLDGDLPDPELTSRHYRFLAKKANAHGFLAVFPRGLVGSFPTLPRSRAWAGDPARERENRDFLYALVEHLTVKFPLDRRRVVLGGFSNGAHLAAKELLENTAGPFTGFWIEAGGVLDERQRLSPRPEMAPVYISVSSDDWQNRGRAQDLRDRLRRAGWEAAGRLRFEEDGGGHALREAGFDAAWKFLNGIS